MIRRGRLIALMVLVAFCAPVAAFDGVIYPIPGAEDVTGWSGVEHCRDGRLRTTHTIPDGPERWLWLDVAVGAEDIAWIRVDGVVIEGTEARWNPAQQPRRVVEIVSSCLHQPVTMRALGGQQWMPLWLAGSPVVHTDPYPRPR